MSKCKLQKGDVSILIEEKILDAKGNSWSGDWTVNCALEAGTVLRIPYEQQELKKEQQDTELPAAPESLPKPIPARKKKTTKKVQTKVVKHSKESKKQKETQASELIVTDAIEKPVKEKLVPLTKEKNEEKKEGAKTMPKSDPQLIATVQQPTPDAVSSDLMKIAKDNATDPTVTIILAVLAVFGGGAAFKFYRQWSEQKHEEKMAKIKIDSKNQDKSPGECQTVHAKLTAEVADIKSRIGTLENKVSIDADFDGERLEKRVKKLEKWRKESEE